MRAPMLLLFGVLGACASVHPGPGDLTLAGPTVVHVKQLGPVGDTPELRGPDGSIRQPMAISAQPESVARIQDGFVHAIGEGTATITLTEGEQELTWTLIVEPQPVLHFVEPPERLRVGERIALTVRSSGGQAKVSLASHDEDIAKVDAKGTLVGMGHGRVWISATDDNGAEAMIEVLVVAPKR